MSELFTTNPITYVNGTSVLDQYRRVFESAGVLRYAQATELEVGLLGRKAFPNQHAGVQPMYAPGQFPMVANGFIAKGSTIYRANEGKVASGGSDEIGIAATAATSDGDVITVTTKFSATVTGGVADPNFIEHLGTYDPTTNTPALTDASGARGNQYKIGTAPIADQVRDFGSGNITFLTGETGELLHNGTIWEYFPSSATGGGNDIQTVADIADRTTKFPAPNEGDEALHSAVTSNGLRYKYIDDAWIPISYHVTDPVTILPTLELVENQTVTLIPTGGPGAELYIYRDVDETAGEVFAWDQVDGGGSGGGATENRKVGLDDLGTLSGTVAVDFTALMSDNKKFQLGGNVTDFTLTFGDPGHYQLVIEQGSGSSSIVKPPNVSGNYFIDPGADVTTHTHLYWDGTEAVVVSRAVNS